MRLVSTVILGHARHESKLAAFVTLHWNCENNSFIAKKRRTPLTFDISHSHSNLCHENLLKTWLKNNIYRDEEALEQKSSYRKKAYGCCRFQILLSLHVRGHCTLTVFVKNDKDTIIQKKKTVEYMHNIKWRKNLPKPFDSILFLKIQCDLKSKRRSNLI